MNSAGDLIEITILCYSLILKVVVSITVDIGKLIKVQILFIAAALDHGSLGAMPSI